MDRHGRKYTTSWRSSGAVGTGCCTRRCTHKATKIRLVDASLPPPSARSLTSRPEIDHRNIVRLHDVLCNQKRIYLVLEFMDQDLNKFMDVFPGFAKNHTLIKSYLQQLLHGIEYLHSHRLFHRDLKPQNLLIDGDGRTLKIADFGLSRAFGPSVHELTHEVVTLWYRAPEILLGDEMYSTPIDIWSVGCIFAEMINQKPLFPGESEIDQLFKIFSWPGFSLLRDFKPAIFPRFQAQDLAKIVPDLEPAGLDLLSKMLRYEPRKRITARQALEHEYFKLPAKCA